MPEILIINFAKGARS